MSLQTMATVKSIGRNEVVGTDYDNNSDILWNLFDNIDIDNELGIL